MFPPFDGDYFNIEKFLISSAPPGLNMVIYIILQQLLQVYLVFSIGAIIILNKPCY